MSRKVIVLIGSKGNIGKVLLDKLHASKFEIATIESSASLDTLYSLKSASLIINSANRYFPNPTEDQILLMEHSIIGLAESIVKEAARLNCPILHLSSYFQYPPKELAPWSKYSEFKNRAVALYQNASNEIGISNFEVVLYDNYGGTRGGKILDLLIESGKKKLAIETTGGESILNHSYIGDIADALKNMIEEIFTLKDKTVLKWQLRGPNDYTLKQLDGMIMNALGHPTKVIWGAKPYRKKEVFEIWNCAQNWPHFKCTMSLQEYILHEIKK
jgi:nucleoside-diphosphate-sugar epimerase